jgi:membrane-anchored glycerophosphoryl diester phosphodiesterase (GDPDase)
MGQFDACVMLFVYILICYQMGRKQLRSTDQCSKIKRIFEWMFLQIKSLTASAGIYFLFKDALLSENS